MIIRPDPGEFAVRMTDWTVREISLPRLKNEPTSRHLCGMVDNVEGRVCSPIRSFDADSMSFITRSGKFYYVVGPPGGHADSEYVWARWTDMQGVKSTDYKDVTEEYYEQGHMADQ